MINPRDEHLLNEYKIYLQTKRGRKYSTALLYARIMRYLLNYTGRTIETISDADISRWFLELVAKKMDRNTQCLRSTVVREFFKWYSSQYLRPNPAAEFRPIPHKLSDFYYITRDDLVRIVAILMKRLERSKSERQKFIAFRNAAIIMFLADTGVRISELIALRLRDIRIQSNKFIVRVSAGKGRRDREYPFGFLSEESLTSEIFAAYWLITRQMHWHPDTPLFPCADRWPDLFEYASNRNMYNMIVRIGKEAGIKLTPHSLRHFYATYCLANGMSIKTIQHNLGHATLSSTEPYIHLAERESDHTLSHIATAGLKVPTPFEGFTKIVKGLIAT